MNVKCGFCTQPFSSSQWKRRVEYRWPEAQAGLPAPLAIYKVYGPGMEAGPASEARGPLAQVFHYKCHFAALSREKLEAAKADSGEQPTEPPDWREQEVVEVGELVPGEGERNNRGPGAEGL